jgi:hypothetical protein
VARARMAGSCRELFFANRIGTLQRATCAARGLH